MQKSLRVIAAAGIAAALSLPSTASAQTWTQWTSATVGVAASGNAGGVGVSYAGGFDGYQLTNYSTGGVVTASGCGYDFFTCAPLPYTSAGVNPVDNNSFIQYTKANSGTIYFSQKVHNPLLAFISVGQSSVPVTYSFGGIYQFSVISDNSVNGAAWGGGSVIDHPGGVFDDRFTGREFSGVVRFLGDYDFINIAVENPEDWHGFSVGFESASTVTPEPSTYALMGVGLFAIGFARRRRKA